MSTPQTDELLQAALSYAERGWSVIPLHCVKDGRCTCGKVNCQKPGKHPRVPWAEFQKRHATEVEIKQWWHQWPGANVGVITGAVSGLLALDVDSEEGKEALRRKHIPLTPTVITGSGGTHYYFGHPGGTVPNGVRVLPGCDIRADGGLVVAVPSLHASGNCYEWVPGLSLEDVELAPCPDWLLEILRPKTGLSRNVEDWRRLVHNKVYKGERNNTIASLAGHLFRKYVDPYIVLDLLLAWNRCHCVPPLSDDEVAQTVDSVAGLELRRRKGLKRDA